MYVTQQHYIDTYGELELIQLTDQNNIGTIDSVVFERHLATAEDMVNQRLMSQYVIPLTVVNAEIIDIILCILRDKLHVAQNIDEVTRNYADAMKRLNEYVTGHAVIDGAETQTQSKQQTSSQTSKAVFDDDVFAMQ